MTTQWKLTLFALATILILGAGCKKEDPPAPVNPEELITTLQATFTPQGGGTPVTFEFKDLDGEGPNAPVITNGKLEKNSSYQLSLLLLNETVSADMSDPEYNITLEVEGEAEAHQFFFAADSSLTLEVQYGDLDSNGKPLGLNNTAITGSAGTGAFTITLRHNPDKSALNVSDGDLTNAGGETDIEAVFQVEIQ